MKPARAGSWQVSRRLFLKLCAAFPGAADLFAADEPFRFGVVTDVHYADREAAGTRHYRLGISKLRAVIGLMNAERVRFLIELGDFKDQDPKPSEERTLAYLKDIEGVFRGFRGPRYHVLGNHDMDSLSKEQFHSVISNTGVDGDRTWYSFDHGGFHFVVLDANFRRDTTPYDKGNFDWRDTNIPPEQAGWLERDLKGTRRPTVVFVHQRLDEGTRETSIANRAAVRQILQDSGIAVLVMQGHVHEGAYQQIGGIHYYTQVASVEGGKADDATCTIVTLHATGAIEITGYERAASRKL